MVLGTIGGEHPHEHLDIRCARPRPVSYLGSIFWKQLRSDRRPEPRAGQAQAQGQPPPGKKPKPRKKSSKKQARLGNQTAAEAVLDVVEKKRFSKKINYTVLQGIFGGQKKRKAADSPSGSKKMRPIAEEDDDDDAPEVPGTTI